jgi:hypothetical protein
MTQDAHLRLLAEADRERERHYAPPTKGFHHTFDPVDRMEWRRTQPSYKTVAITFDPLRRRRVAILHVSSTDIRLFVDVEPAFEGVKVGKNARKRLRRLGVAPVAVQHKVDALCMVAVARYWAK